MHMVDGVALQEADFHRLAFGVVVAHADILAQDFRRADAGAAAAQDVLFQDAGGGAVDVLVVDVADEAGHVDFRRTDAAARRVVAVQAAGAFDGRLARRQGRRQVREMARQFLVGQGGMRQIVQRFDHRVFLLLCAAGS